MKSSKSTLNVANWEKSISFVSNGDEVLDS